MLICNTLIIIIIIIIIIVTIIIIIITNAKIYISFEYFILHLKSAIFS